MEIKFVLGRAGSGKSRYILNAIKEEIKDPLKKIYVLVPEQITFQTEKSIISSCGLKGLFGLQVLSINRLAQRILEDAGKRAQDVVGMSGKMALMSIAINKVKDELLIFKGSALTQGFIEGADEIINELKKQRISPEEFLKASEDEVIKEKVKDIAKIYEAYESLYEKYDLEDMTEQAIKNVQRTDMFDDSVVIIDGFDTLTAQMHALLSEIMLKAKRTYISLRFCRGRRRRIFIRYARRDEAQVLSKGKRGGGKRERSSSA